MRETEREQTLPRFLPIRAKTERYRKNVYKTYDSVDDEITSAVMIEHLLLLFDFRISFF